MCFLHLNLRESSSFPFMVATVGSLEVKKMISLEMMNGEQGVPNEGVLPYLIKSSTCKIESSFYLKEFGHPLALKVAKVGA